MDYSQSDKLFSRKNIIYYLILLILILAIPLSIRLVQTQQQLKSRAAAGEVSFRGEGVNCPAAGECTATQSQIEVVLDSPFGAGP